ncbi:MAG: aminotransferase class I/II-fold pyridoxal phosphate-dependent enzyme [Deltaproteobacteria bacterium]|nr:aminotransferase class I/II-fold pyridoxal phosphate-dependent enzyme [Deltaproteobacteria bacterium]
MKKERKDLSERRPYKMGTHLIHGKFHSKKWEYRHHVVPPLTSSTTFRLDTQHRGAHGFFDFACDHPTEKKHVPIYIYDRLDEPTRGMLEENLAFVEGSEVSVAFASGMAAVSAACLVSLKAGDEILANDILYGCTYSLLTNWLPRLGIKVHFADLTREGYEKSITPKTKAIYFESPLNPNLKLVDIGRLRKRVDQVNAKRNEDQKIVLIIDNTFATPFCQRPISLGVDIVVHSLTKDIGGFGTDMGGAVMASEKYHNSLLLFRKDFGAVLSPKNAWPILVYGLPTLGLRMKQQQVTALKVARFLEGNPKVEKVYYPGLPSFPQLALAKKQMIDFDGNFAPGSMIYFLLKGKTEHEAERFIDRIAKDSYSITLAVSLGQVRTLIENPFSMTHSGLPEEEKRKKGVEPNGIRLSIGLEEPEDIISDLKRALG